MSEVADVARIYQWLNKSNIRANIKALIMAAQEQVHNTRAVAHKIYHIVEDPRCRLWKQHAESVEHTSGCSKLAGTEYTVKHNKMASIVYRVICAE